MKTVHRWGALAVFLIVLTGGGSAASAQTAFAIDTSSNLYRVNLQSGAATLVGHNSSALMEGLAYDTVSGRLWGTDDGGTIHEIDPNSGANISGVNTPIFDPEGLDFNAPNSLWLADSNSTMTMHQFNTLTNTLGPALSTNAADGAARALAFNQAGTRAYFIGDLPASPNQSLWRFDLAGSATLVGPTGTQFSNGSILAAIDMDLSGTMWGLDGSGRVGTVNLNTGAFTLSGVNTGGQFWLDMSLIPEPAGVLTLTACATCAALSRLLRRCRPGR